MKKLAVLYSGDSRGLNGAALYVDRFRKFKTAFESAGIEPFICDSNTISSNANNDDEVIEVETDYANSATHHFKNKIKKLLSNTYIGSKVYINLAWERPGKKSIKRNISIIENADILLANDLFCAYYALSAFPNKELYFVMHNSGVLLKMLFDRLPTIVGRKKEKQLRKIEETIFNKSKGVLFVSRKARDAFITNYPQFKEKAYYVPEGIEDVKKIPSLDFNNIKLICVGTVCERKNQLELLKAFSEIKDPEIELNIVGGGALLNECRNYANIHDMRNVNFIGSVKNADIPFYLSQSNVFILVSKDEGLPAVGIEAIRSGLPILITDVGGCSELVKNNGLVLSGFDKDSIKKGIEFIMKKTDWLPEMSINSRHLYEKEYSIDTMVSTYKKILVDEDYGK